MIKNMDYDLSINKMSCGHIYLEAIVVSKQTVINKFDKLFFKEK